MGGGAHRLRVLLDEFARPQQESGPEERGRRRMMTPRWMKALLSLCLGSVLTLGGNGALAAGDAADESLPAMLSPGGGNPPPVATEPAPVADSS
ncbi:cellulose biosynthesis cyclic di-GMP-binding regulatory protein BcsB, partial [Dickeya dianthicola]|nr:cellulose biosynthesis cyclic di-GMP-binding regulatory protein BcsB [Dickeya dianthicola]